MTPYNTSIVTVDGVDIFYRSAGHPSSPVLFLLHGFPSSSHQYRNLIPLLSNNYHVIAPDFPGFGFTTVPAHVNGTSIAAYQYTFASLALTMSMFLTAMKISKFSMYIFDYGAPIGLRLALEEKFEIEAIISQNGNAYTEGLGADFWAPVMAYWRSGDINSPIRQSIRGVLTPETTKSFYISGTPSTIAIQPESYTLDSALLARPGNDEIQLDLFYDYRTNVAMYPTFQKWLRESKTPVLAVWGKNDAAFVPAGAEAFKKDVKDLEIHLLDAGHFAVESNTEEIARLTRQFLGKRGIGEKC